LSCGIVCGDRSWMHLILFEILVTCQELQI